MAQNLAKTLEWRIERGPVDYPAAVSAMEIRVRDIRLGHAPELVWLLEHPPIYTAGTSANPRDLVQPSALPVFATGRGGQYTYHGPGQRVAYVMLDLNRRGRDVRQFVANLEAWLIAALAGFGVIGLRRHGRVGVWVDHAGREEKIAAVGIRLRHWVSFHGVSLNVAPDLSHYQGIVPCGIASYGVTSLAALGLDPSPDEVDRVLRKTFSAAMSAGPAIRIPG
jgi:lipoyl(octanoyl) transferase